MNRPQTILNRLPALVAKRQGGMSVREAAAEAGMCPATFHRARTGENLSAENFCVVADWLGLRFVPTPDTEEK